MMLLNDVCRRLFVLFSLKSKSVFTKRTLRMTLAIDVWSCSVWSQSVFDYGHFLRVLLRITGGSCHNYKICRDKGFVCLSRQTWTLRQQKYVCRYKSWTVLVVTKMLFAFWRRKRGVMFCVTTNHQSNAVLLIEPCLSLQWQGKSDTFRALKSLCFCFYFNSCSARSQSALMTMRTPPRVLSFRLFCLV